MATIEADYLVIGAGATGMAFVDTLVSETTATVAVVDRNHQPGGHWTTAYPFVRLHQPSAYYGVNSRPLGSDTDRPHRVERGLLRVGRRRRGVGLLRRGHAATTVTDGAGLVLSDERVPRRRPDPHTGGDDIHVTARRIVDTTFVGVTVPSMRPPPYDVAPEVDCIPPNDLPKYGKRDRYVIVGAGKTAMDTCLWLLGHGIAPQRLTWIKPRDAWLLNRAGIQPGKQFAKQVLADVSAQLKSVELAESVEDLFARLADAGCLLRIDESIDPEMYRCAIVSRAELEQLRRIDDVVRMGHVKEIEPGRVVLDGGSLPIAGSALYIDCTAVGLGRREVSTVFDGDRITLQTVRTCQPVFSAALIAHVEADYADDDTRNALCRPIPNPEVPLDWLRMMLTYNGNQLRWFDEPEVMAWLDSARLNILSHATAAVSPRAREKIIGVLRSQLRITNDKLEKLLR